MIFQYGTTWEDLGRTPPARAWLMIRALRNSPPGLASSSEIRHRFFNASLEQSEQFFRSASSAGPETRALLLFYGISQAGRAVRAVHESTDKWMRAGGHGISVVGTSTDGLLADVVLESKRSGNYRSVANSLQRDPFGSRETVGDITSLLWPGSQFKLKSKGIDDPPLKLTFDPSSKKRLLARLAVPLSTWDSPLPPPPARSDEDYSRLLSHLEKRISIYPTLTGARPLDLPERPVAIHPIGDGFGELTLEWPDRDAPDMASPSPLIDFSDEPGPQVAVYPKHPEMNHATHPFLLWWSVLYAMSHMIRYEPLEWERMTRVNSSREAVAIENIGQFALDGLPELIHKTISRPLVPSGGPAELE